MTSLTFTAAAVLVALGANPLRAQTAPKLAATLDSIAGAEVRANRSVGVVAAVVKGNAKLLLGAYGKIDVEGNAPLNVETMVPIGSVTKQFTAVAILQLRDKGKLGIDDDVTRWLPDLETGGNRITLRHLLAHTAGIVELGDMPELRTAQMMRNSALSRDSIYSIVRKYSPAFPVGTMESYSNTGYWLLGRIIEKASGMKYEDYVEKQIFKPLGMSRTMICDSSKHVPNAAKGHNIRNGVSVRSPEIVYNAIYSAGAICSTGGDLITWLKALHGGRVLSPKSYTELITPAKLADGTPLRYSMGTAIGEDSHGFRYVGHNGGGFGFSSETRWFPDSKLAVVVLTNSEPDAITATTAAMVAAVLPTPRPRAAFAGDATRILGRYKGRAGAGDMVVVTTQTPQGVAFSVNGQPAEALASLGDWAFRRGDDRLSFRIGPNAEPASELHYDTGGDHFILKRTAAATTTALTTPLSAFEGTYEGLQPGTTLRIVIESDTLRAAPSAGGKANLIPESGTTFYYGREGAPRTVMFTLGADGKAISVTLKAPGNERVLNRIP